ncbi:MAG: hypothetical protein ACFCVG_05410, partial [Kineosporiaceae bacterium]
MTTTWPRPAGPSVGPSFGLPVRSPAGALVEPGAEDDAVPAARTWLRLSLLAAFPGFNPLWWVAAGPAVAARARARRRPFSAERALR